MTTPKEQKGNTGTRTEWRMMLLGNKTWRVMCNDNENPNAQRILALSMMYNPRGNGREPHRQNNNTNMRIHSNPLTYTLTAPI